MRHSQTYQEMFVLNPKYPFQGGTHFKTFPTMESLTNLVSSLEIDTHKICVPKQHNTGAIKNGKYYVVALGHTTGIFRDWCVCFSISSRFIA